MRLRLPDFPEASKEMSNSDLIPSTLINAGEKSYFELRMEILIQFTVGEIYDLEQEKKDLLTKKGPNAIQTKVKMNEIKLKRIKLNNMRQNLATFLTYDWSQQQQVSRRYQDDERQGRIDPNGTIVTPPTGFK